MMLCFLTAVNYTKQFQFYALMNILLLLHKKKGKKYLVAFRCLSMFCLKLSVGKLHENNLASMSSAFYAVALNWRWFVIVYSLNIIKAGIRAAERIFNN